MTTNPARDTAFALQASRDGILTNSYLNRGRRFSAMTAGSLADEFVTDMRRCARAPQNWPSLEHKDLVAEFDLRGLEPPYEEVMDEIDRIAEHLKAANAAASEEDLSKVYEAVERDLAALRKRRN